MTSCADEDKFIPVFFNIKNGILTEIYVNKKEYLKIFLDVVGEKKVKILINTFKNNIEENLKNYIDDNPEIASKMYNKLNNPEIQCNKTSKLSEMQLKIYNDAYGKIGNTYIRWDKFRIMVFSNIFSNIHTKKYISTEEYKIYTNYFLECKLCCNMKFIDKLALNMNVSFETKHVDKSYKNMIEYISIIKKYSKVYSLGDSLDKYNLIAKIFKPDIFTIPFSGSMYDDVENKEIIVLNKKEKKKIKENIHNLVKNNKEFKNLYVDVAKGEKVIITDFVNAQQKATDEMRASGSMDREAFQAKRKEMNDARDLKLKEIFTFPGKVQWGS